MMENQLKKPATVVDADTPRSALPMITMAGEEETYSTPKATHPIPIAVGRAFLPSFPYPFPKKMLEIMPANV